MNKAIEVKNLSYSYFGKKGETKAVNNISFHLDEGEILGFLGPNGAGKSTTWRILIGLMKPMHGDVLILNKDILKKKKAIQAEIGVCFEYPNLYEEMTARENLSLFAKLFGIKDFDVDDLLKRIDFEEKGKLPVREYSKGMKQRIMVARSLINRPKILFLDEPTSGLDPVSAKVIRGIILEEKERGASVFLTTHDMQEADKLSDRVAFLNEGQITALDTPLGLKEQYGKRLFQIQTRENGDLISYELNLEEKETPDKVKTILAEKEVVTAHSTEATLEEIFIKINGRSLQ